jgi:hypothetical protein
VSKENGNTARRSLPSSPGPVNSAKRQFGKNDNSAKTAAQNFARKARQTELPRIIDQHLPIL